MSATTDSVQSPINDAEAARKKQKNLKARQRARAREKNKQTSDSSNATSRNSSDTAGSMTAGAASTNNPSFLPSYKASATTKDKDKKSDAAANATATSIDSKTQQETVIKSIKAKLLSIYIKAICNQKLMEDSLASDKEALCARLFPNYYKAVGSYSNSKKVFDDLCNKRMGSYRVIAGNIEELIQVLEKKPKHSNNDSTNNSYLNLYYDKLRLGVGRLEIIEKYNLGKISMDVLPEHFEFIKMDYTNIRVISEQFDQLLNDVTPLIEDRQKKLWDYAIFAETIIRDSKGNYSFNISRIIKIKDFNECCKTTYDTFLKSVEDHSKKNYPTTIRDYIEEIQKFLTQAFVEMSTLCMKREAMHNSNLNDYKVINDGTRVDDERGFDSKKNEGLASRRELRHFSEESTNELFYTLYDFHQRLIEKQTEFNMVMGIFSAVDDIIGPPPIFAEVDQKFYEEFYGTNSEKLFKELLGGLISNDARRATAKNTNASTKSSDVEGRIVKTESVQNSTVSSAALKDNSTLVESTEPTEPTPAASASSSDVKLQQETAKTSYAKAFPRPTERVLNAEEFMRLKAEKIEEYRKKVEADKLARQMGQRSFLNTIKSSNTKTTDFSLVNKMNNILSTLQPDELDYMLSFFVKDKNFEFKEFHEFMKKLQFIPRKIEGASKGYHYIFGTLSFICELAHPSQIKAGRSEVPLGAIGNLKEKVLVELGVDKNLLLELKANYGLKRLPTVAQTAGDRKSAAGSRIGNKKR